MNISMTLDGFVAGPNGEMDWLAIDPESWAAEVERMQQETDTVSTKKLIDLETGFRQLCCLRKPVSIT
jgi:hypothetical protein